MHRLLELFARHPWSVLGSLLLVSLLATLQLEHVRIHVASDELLVIDDPDRAFHQQIAEEFGDEMISLMVLRDDQLLDPAKLKVLATGIEELNALPFVERTDSLFNIPHLRTVDGYLNSDPYLKQLPANAPAGASLLEQALISPFLKHVLLSEDRRTMAVAIVLKHPDTEDGIGPDDLSITRALDEIAAQMSTAYGEVFTIGFPHIRTEIAHNIAMEQGDLVPLAIAALLISLFLLLRQLLDILVPVLTAGLSVLWTLGLMGLLDLPLNVVTSIVPILLIIVGSTEDIHLLSEFRRAQRDCKATDAAVAQMSRKMGRIVALTFITTFAGFLSVTLSGIEVLVQFGIVAAAGLALNFLITISLIPALLTLAGRYQLDGRSQYCDGSHSSAANRYWDWLHRQRKPIILLLVLITVLAGLGMPKIHINHNPTESLGDHSLAREHIETVNQQLAGLESFSVVLDSGIEDTFLKARYVNELVKIQDFVAQLDKARGAGHSSTSFADYLALLNAAFEEVPKPKQPRSDDIINELMIFLNYDHVKAYVSPDYSKARILIRHNIAETGELKDYLGAIQSYIDKHLDPGLDARITGDSVLTLSATRAMITGQLKSIGLLMLIIVIIIGLLFAELKVGLLALLPNVFPVIVLFGIMGWLDIPLNIGTTMAAAIAIGLAVDDTMHFMLRYNHELKSSRSQTIAMHETLRGEALPILATSIALIAGFLVFSFSQFGPIAQFGQLSALVIAAALLADFIITPLAISALRLITLWDLLSLEMRQDVLAKATLFQGMKTWQIRRFILSSRVHHYSAQQAVFQRGDESDAMFLIMSGQVEIHLRKQDKNGHERTEVSEIFGPGELFGDVALLSGDPRQADAVATQSTDLLVLTQEGINQTNRLHPGIAAHLFHNLSKDISRRMVKIITKAHR